MVLAGAVAYAAARLRPVRSLDDELLTRPDPPTRSLEWALAAGLGLYAVQATAAPAVDGAAGTLVTALVPFALLFVLLRRADWTPGLVRTCAAAFVGVAVVLVAVAVGEAATGRLLPAPRVVTDDRLADAFRASSVVFDPDALGRLLAVAALVVAAGLLWARRGRDLALAGVLLLVLWGGLVLTRSTGAAVALLAGLVVLAALRWGARAGAGLAAVLVVAGLAAVVLAPGPLRLDRDPVTAADQATSARASSLRDGAAVALRRPVSGWGSGTVVATLRRERGTSLPRARAAARTAPLTVAVEQGALGLAAWLAILWLAARRLLLGAGRSPARAALAAALVALVVDALLHGALLEDPTTWAVLGAGSALAFADRRRRPRRRGPPPPPRRPARSGSPRRPEPGRPTSSRGRRSRRRPAAPTAARRARAPSAPAPTPAARRPAARGLPRSPPAPRRRRPGRRRARPRAPTSARRPGRASPSAGPAVRPPGRRPGPPPR